VPIEWLADFLKLIHDTPNLDWLLLTKRLENWDRRMELVVKRFWNTPQAQGIFSWAAEWHEAQEPPHNIWLGASVEDQQRADERIPQLLAIPAKVRFLSVEPLLGPVDLSFAMPWQVNDERGIYKRGLDWVIIGGESGRNARPCSVEWIRDIIRQCKAAGVACFVKQLGSLSIVEDIRDWIFPDPEMLADCTIGHIFRTQFMQQHPKGGDPSEWPEDLRVREFPKT
jgi:protein gp37